LRIRAFAEGLAADAVGLAKLVEHCPDLLVASSYSKNFGLYNERVGALTLVAAKPDACRHRAQPHQARDSRQLL
jgi:aspartate/tyrosine/aromatic aminotransferase